MIANVASAAWSNAKYAAIATCAACVHSAFGSLPDFHASTNRSSSPSLSSNANVSWLGAGLVEFVFPDAVECVSIRFLSPFLLVYYESKEILCQFHRLVDKDRRSPWM